MKLLERQLSASHADDVNVDGELHPNFEASWREYMPGEWHAGRVCSISLISPKEPAQSRVKPCEAAKAELRRHERCGMVL